MATGLCDTWSIRVWPQVLARWRSVAGGLCQYSGAAVRAHLALFYFYGCYYHWSKRATGEADIFQTAFMSSSSCELVVLELPLEGQRGKVSP